MNWNNIIQSGKHDVLVEMILLLFADDIVLLSDTAIGLQNQPNILSKSAETQTSQQTYKNQFIIVLRNGGHLAGRERCEKSGELINILVSFIGLDCPFCPSSRKT